MEAPEQFFWSHSDVFIVNFEKISHIFLMFSVMIFNK